MNLTDSHQELNAAFQEELKGSKPFKRYINTKRVIRLDAKEDHC